MAMQETAVALITHLRHARAHLDILIEQVEPFAFPMAAANEVLPGWEICTQNGWSEVITRMDSSDHIAFVCVGTTVFASLTEDIVARPRP